MRTQRPLGNGREKRKKKRWLRQPSRYYNQAHESDWFNPLEAYSGVRATLAEAAALWLVCCVLRKSCQSQSTLNWNHVSSTHANLFSSSHHLLVVVSSSDLLFFFLGEQFLALVPSASPSLKEAEYLMSEKLRLLDAGKAAVWDFVVRPILSGPGCRARFILFCKRVILIEQDFMFLAKHMNEW